MMTMNNILILLPTWQAGEAMMLTIGCGSGMMNNYFMNVTHNPMCVGENKLSFIQQATKHRNDHKGRDTHRH